MAGASTSHHCGPGSNPGRREICSGTKTKISKSQFDLKTVDIRAALQSFHCGRSLNLVCLLSRHFRPCDVTLENSFFEIE